MATAPLAIFVVLFGSLGAMVMLFAREDAAADATAEYWRSQAGVLTQVSLEQLCTIVLETGAFEQFLAGWDA
jgi:hypothetical protein